jgi:hypothetical protein
LSVSLLNEVEAVILLVEVNLIEHLVAEANLIDHLVVVLKKFEAKLWSY